MGPGPSMLSELTQLSVHSATRSCTTSHFSNKESEQRKSNGSSLVILLKMPIHLLCSYVCICIFGFGRPIIVGEIALWGRPGI